MNQLTIGELTNALRETTEEEHELRKKEQRVSEKRREVYLRLLRLKEQFNHGDYAIK